MASSQKRNRWIVGAGIIAAAVVGISLLQLKTNSVYFYVPHEAMAQAQTLAEKVIRVGGMVEAGSVQWKPEDLDLRFTLSDLKGSRLAVEYRGAPPDMFKENSGVVVEGRISGDGQSFTAHKLMVKHSEEYKVPGKDHSLDKELLEKSFSGQQ
jgi:cytochrome c-type biogenesis protein CcmE